MFLTVSDGKSRHPSKDTEALLSKWFVLIQIDLNLNGSKSVTPGLQWVPGAITFEDGN
jgi:hypothetical protein